MFNNVCVFNNFVVVILDLFMYYFGKCVSFQWSTNWWHIFSIVLQSIWCPFIHGLLLTEIPLAVFVFTYVASFLHRPQSVKSVVTILIYFYSWRTRWYEVCQSLKVFLLVVFVFRHVLQIKDSFVLQIICTKHSMTVSRITIHAGMNSCDLLIGFCFFLLKHKYYNHYYC